MSNPCPGYVIGHIHPPALHGAQCEAADVSAYGRGGGGEELTGGRPPIAVLNFQSR